MRKKATTAANPSQGGRLGDEKSTFGLVAADSRSSNGSQASRAEKNSGRYKEKGVDLKNSSVAKNTLPNDDLRRSEQEERVEDGGNAVACGHTIRADQLGIQQVSHEKGLRSITPDQPMGTDEETLPRLQEKTPNNFNNKVVEQHQEGHDEYLEEEDVENSNKDPTTANQKVVEQHQEGADEYLEEEEIENISDSTRDPTTANQVPIPASNTNDDPCPDDVKKVVVTYKNTPEPKIIFNEKGERFLEEGGYLFPLDANLRVDRAKVLDDLFGDDDEVDQRIINGQDQVIQNNVQEAVQEGEVGQHIAIQNVDELKQDPTHDGIHRNDDINVASNDGRTTPERRSSPFSRRRFPRVRKPLPPHLMEKYAEYLEKPQQEPQGIQQNAVSNSYSNDVNRGHQMPHQKEDAVPAPYDPMIGAFGGPQMPRMDVFQGDAHLHSQQGLLDQQIGIDPNLPTGTVLGTDYRNVQVKTEVPDEVSEPPQKKVRFSDASFNNYDNDIFNDDQPSTSATGRSLRPRITNINVKPFDASSRSKWTSPPPPPRSVDQHDDDMADFGVPNFLDDSDDDQNRGGNADLPIGTALGQTIRQVNVKQEVVDDDYNVQQSNVVNTDNNGDQKPYLLRDRRTSFVVPKLEDVKPVIASRPTSRRTSASRSTSRRTSASRATSRRTAITVKKEVEDVKPVISKSKRTVKPKDPKDILKYDLVDERGQKKVVEIDMTKGRVDSKYVEVVDNDMLEGLANQYCQIVDPPGDKKKKSKKEEPKEAVGDAYEAERILRVSVDPNTRKKTYLVEWIGWNSASTTMEELSNLRGCPRLIQIFVDLEHTCDLLIKKYVEKGDAAARQLLPCIYTMFGRFLSNPEWDLELERPDFDQKYGKLWKWVEMARKWNEMERKPFVTTNTDQSPLYLEAFHDDAVLPEKFEYLTQNRVGSEEVKLYLEQVEVTAVKNCTCNCQSVCPTCNKYFIRNYRCELKGNRLINLQKGAEHALTLETVLCGGDTCQFKKGKYRGCVLPRRSFPLLIAYRPEVKGVGVYAIQRIPEYHIICEYTGEMLTTDEAADRDTSYQMAVVGHHLVIDAEKMGNEGRFMNHSCEPNCGILRMHRGHGHAVPRLYMYSRRNIDQGEELTIDYHPELTVDKGKDVASLPNASDCSCNARKCRGKV